MNEIKPRNSVKMLLQISNVPRSVSIAQGKPRLEQQSLPIFFGRWPGMRCPDRGEISFLMHDLVLTWAFRVCDDTTPIMDDPSVPNMT